MECAGRLLSIINLTWLILRKNWKHFLCIASLMVIPSYAFHRPVFDASSSILDVLVSLIMEYQLYFSLSDDHPAASPLASMNISSTDYHLPPSPVLHLSSFFPIIARQFLLTISSLISYPLLTFSVCRAFLDKPVCFKGSLLGIPRSAKNLVCTWLCVGVLVFGLAMMALGTAIAAGILVALTGEHKFAIEVVRCIAMAMAVVGLYVAVLFSLANTAAILEEKARGWKAMKRSMDLLKGQKWLALGLVCVFYVLLGPDKLWQWRGAQIVRASLQAAITMFGMAANIVMYMTCRRAHKEEPGLDTLVAAVAEFGPPPKLQAMDVETAAFIPTLPI